MKILRSEAVDKSPGVFLDPEHDFKGPGTPGAIQQAKKPIFQKIRKFPKNCKKIPLVSLGTRVECIECPKGPGSKGPKKRICAYF